MENRKIIIPDEYAKSRLDKALADLCPDLTRSNLKRLLDEGNILLNKKIPKASKPVLPGDKVEIKIEQPREPDIKPADIPLEILYEDDFLLAVNKKRGMVVHPAPGHSEDTLVNALLSHCGGSLSGINGRLRPGIIHRLDKDTTGALLVAKGDLAHVSLSAQLKNRTMTRRYTAIVHGNIKEDRLTVDAPLGRDAKDRKKMSVNYKSADSREAVTEVTVIGRFGRFTHIYCDLVTGRTHQIRVHMKHINHPVLGDKIYGVKKEPYKLDGQMLHACSLTFSHPATGETMTLTAPPPDDFMKILDILSKEDN